MLKWKIGDVTVTRLVEMETPLPTTMLMPKADPEAVRGVSWLEPFFVDGPETLRMSIHALVIDTPAARIVVDTCMGNDKARPASGMTGFSTDFLARFEAAGFPRDSVDVVLCTHLHVDHVGWNTMRVDGQWVPTFPKARYLISKAEFDFWKDQTEQDRDVIFADSVKPVFDAGLVDLVDTDHAICPEVRLVSTPGHTPGHVSVAIASRGEQAMITGDFMHHPSQMAHPDWGTAFDTDADHARRTRCAQLEGLADGPVLVIGTHFAAPTAGHVVRDGAAYRLDS